MRAYSSSEVQSLTGVSRNQLTHWTDAGLLVADIAEAGGRGKHRRFSFMNLVEAVVAKRLTGYGASRTQLRAWLPCVSLALLGGGGPYLIFHSDGRSHAGELDRDALNLTSRKGSPGDDEADALFIPLKGIVERLSKDTGDAPPPPKPVKTTRGAVELCKAWAARHMPQ